MKMSISTAIEERTDGDDDTSQDSQPKDESSDLENENENEHENEPENRNGAADSPEVHEITSDDDDDCVVTADDDNEEENDEDNDNDEEEDDDDSSSSSSNNSNTGNTTQNNKPPIKEGFNSQDMENGDEESDIEEVAIEDPLNQGSGNKSKPIIISDTRSLADLATKPQSNDQNKEPTVVIIDTNSIMAGKDSVSGANKASVSTPSNSSGNAQSLCQSIAARGTTITPVSVKSTAGSQAAAAPAAPATPAAPILPSLTDDMFVVEAPSFIVPYVYEKPSIKPFKEFVDALGKELEEVRLKEEKEKIEREKEEKEKKEKEKQERRDRGETVEDSDSETKSQDDESTPKKPEKKQKRRRNVEEDDQSWDGESSSETDEAMSDDDVTIIKDKDDAMTDIATLMDSKVQRKSDTYFDCSLGQFFINIGVNLVQEYVQSDLLKQQNRKLYKEKKSGRSTKETAAAIISLSQNLEFSKKTNAPYALDMKRCKICSFKTESELVMAHHMEAPHMKNNIYKCNSCEFEIRSPHDILYHMEAAHCIRGRLERAPAYQQCANCTFEDNSKSKLARHLLACAKKFKPHLNLEPPLEWEPPAKIPKLARARPAANMYPAGFARPAGALAPGQLRPMAGALGALGSRPRGRPPLGGSAAVGGVGGRAAPVPGVPLVRGGLMIMHNSQAAGNYPAAPAASATPKISITPLPRAPQGAPAPATPQLPPPAMGGGKSAFVICEICDGYIKDLEQLRNHMQWIHKVKIHPKMIYNRPPLNCQKCQFRFFTDQGLERHLLGSHGLVTSSMQEAANKGKDAGRCPVCGRVYQWKLLNHVARDHNMTLKPAHLSYKCTVCTATFGMYKQFENHVYSAHSVVAKRVMDKGKAAPAAPAAPSAPARALGTDLLKPIKINDEITIIPQPAKPLPASSKDK